MGQNAQKLQAEIANILTGKTKKGSVPPLWDGNASGRIAEVLTAARPGLRGA